MEEFQFYQKTRFGYLDWVAYRGIGPEGMCIFLGRFDIELDNIADEVSYLMAIKKIHFLKDKKTFGRDEVYKLVEDYWDKESTDTYIKGGHRWQHIYKNTPKINEIPKCEQTGQYKFAI